MNSNLVCEGIHVLDLNLGRHVHIFLRILVYGVLGIFWAAAIFINIILIFVSLRQGNRSNFSHIRDSEVIGNLQKAREDKHNSEVDSSVSSEYRPYSHERTSQVTDSASLNSAQTSEFEDAESGFLAVHLSLLNCPVLQPMKLH